MNRSIIFNAFLTFFVVLFGISVIRFLLTGSNTYDKDFGSFLDFCQNVKPLIPRFSIDTSFIGGSWDVFDFLRIFLNTLLTGFQALAWLGANIINAFSYIAQFLAWLGFNASSYVPRSTGGTGGGGGGRW